MLITTRSLRANRPLSVFTMPIVVAVALMTACNGGYDVSGTSQNEASLSNNDQSATPGSHQEASVSYSTIAAGIWPPQPVGISDIRPFVSESNVESDRATKVADTVSTALSLAMREPQVLALLGHRYEVTGQYTDTDKNGQIQAITVEIFSYSHNQIVGISVDTDHRIITSHQSAREYQPAETESEVQRAIALAADQLLLQGYETSHLIGTGLLAHPTSKEVNSHGNTFYEQRVIYVTFGRGEGTTPLFRANVNLSTETVIKAGPL